MTKLILAIIIIVLPLQSLLQRLLGRQGVVGTAMRHALRKWVNYAREKGCTL